MAEAPHFDMNEQWAVEAEFKVSGTLTDPDTVSATLRKPDGTLVPIDAWPPDGPGAYAISRTSLGLFKVVGTVDQVGSHYVEVVGTGAAEGRERFLFIGDARWPADMLEDFALTSIENVELYIDKVGVQGTKPTEENDLRWIAELINAYSKLVANFTEREFLPATDDLEPDVARKFVYDGEEMLSLAPYEAREISAVTMYSDRDVVDQVELTEGFTTNGYSWYTEPRELSSEGTILRITLPRRRRAYAYSGIEVTVTGKWGAGSVPRDVRNIVEKEVANAYWASRKWVPSNTEIAALLGNRQLAFALDPESERQLEPYSNKDRVP